MPYDRATEGPSTEAQRAAGRTTDTRATEGTSAEGPLTGALPAEDFPLQFARTARFTLGAPRQFTVSPDGERILFLRTAGGRSTTSSLWLFEDGGERVLGDPRALGDDGQEVPEAERIRRERARETGRGVVGYATDAAVRTAVFALAGELWLVGTDGGAPRPLPTAGPAVDPRLSPDGTLVSYVTDGALHVVRADGTGDRPLAVPEGPEVTYGLADHVSAESIGRERSSWWAPDGSALLAVRADTSPVGHWHLADASRPERAPRTLRYPAAGTPNAELSLHLLRLDGGRTRVRLPAAADPATHPAGAWTDPAFEYVVEGGWDAAGPYATVQTRDQRTAHRLDIDPVSGGTTVTDRQHAGTWLEFLPGATALARSGAALGADVPAELDVRAVLGRAGDTVYFTASDEPTETHVWARTPGAGCRRVTDEPGVHTAAVGGDTLVVDSRTPHGHTVTVLRGGRPGGRVAVLTEQPLVSPGPVFLALGERELRTALYLPSGHREGAARLPVLVHSYAGPGVQTVVRSSVWFHAVNQWFAEQGFAVLSIDGRGTPGRGAAWRRTVHGDQLTPVLDDQVDAVRAALARYPEDLDPERVGIRGWSFGGYLAAAAVLHRPDVFHAAVAGAAPTDLALYDTHWKERYLGHPGVQPENYARCSLVAHAHRLTRPLLLVQGMLDDNVVPAHLLRFSRALLAAGRPHSVLPLPDSTHLVTEEGVADTLLRLEVDFLKKSLGV
ncbi:prolyl oligopeptidase family serine peptidase [Streptomyces sp. NPDC059070]|uniref:S9 family peptidase n=1 Tax=Streptomyces sp. NPDC059070 TaxID=3346713 RepID=UPI003689D75C